MFRAHTVIRNPTWEWFWRHCVAAYFPVRNDVIALDGATIYDRSLHNKTATIDNSSGDITTVTTAIGKSLSFSGDGTDDRVDLGSIPPSHPLNMGVSAFGGKISVVAGIRYDATENSNFPRIIDKSDAGSAANGYGIWYDVGGTPGFIFQLNDIGASSDAYEVALSAGDELQLGYATNDVQSVGQFYHDGLPVLTNRTQDSAVGLPLATTNMAIGNWNHTIDRMWGGLIHYVYIFDDLANAVFFRNIYRDPFGPFNFVDDVPLFVTPPAAGGSILARPPPLRQPLIRF